MQPSSTAPGFIPPYLYPLQTLNGVYCPTPASVQPNPEVFLHPYFPGGLMPVMRPPAMIAPKSKSFTIDAILGKSSEKSKTSEPRRERPDRREREMRQDGTAPRQYPYIGGLPSTMHPIALPPTPLDMVKEKRSPGLSPRGEWKNGKTKRVRTIFTPEQLERLEAEFARQQYMVGTERFCLAARLHLTEAQVKVWFQNRRIKWRKNNHDKGLVVVDQFHKDLESEDDSDDEADMSCDQNANLNMMVGNVVLDVKENNNTTTASPTYSATSRPELQRPCDREYYTSGEAADNGGGVDSRSGEMELTGTPGCTEPGEISAGHMTQET